MNNNLNQISLTGMISAPVRFSHEIFGEMFFETFLKIPRSGEKADLIPVVISDRTIDITSLSEDQIISVEGQLRSYNQEDGDMHFLSHRAFAQSVSAAPEKPVKFMDQVKLEGYVCTQPACRITPGGKQITGFLLAVNRLFDRADYISCICWGRNAVYASGFETGAFLRVEGRLQSRSYRKILQTGKVIKRQVYEVSVIRMRRLDLADISA